MNFVVLDSLGPDRLKRSQPNVKSDLGGLNAAFSNAIENLWREMQARGGRRDRPNLLRIDRLVTIPVGGRIGAINVGWKRHVPNPVERSVEIIRGMKANLPLSECAPRQHFRVQVVSLSEEQVLAYSNLAAGTNQALPLVRLT